VTAAFAGLAAGSAATKQNRGRQVAAAGHRFRKN